jgi:cyclic pyranopterin phosphate synthase
MIKDGHGRVHNYLRISMTDNCNLRCFYCMPEEDYDFTPQARLMQSGEIEAIAKVFVSQGVDKIRLTGGEPLVRKDAGDIIRRLSNLPVNLTMTTNGTRLHEYADLLQECGVRSLNISLDTLDRDKFLLMTRRDQFERVYANIRMMVDRGFHVKVNVVVMKGLNDGEILDFIEWTKHEPVHVRFIEFMPFNGNHWANEKLFTWHQVMEVASSAYDVLPLEHVKHETVKKYIVPGHKGTFAVISTMSAPFCSDCNRMRLTADGKMKNCLFSSSESDLLTALRNGEDILPIIHANVAAKARQLGGQFEAVPDHVHAEEIHNRSMIAIGG